MNLHKNSYEVSLIVFKENSERTVVAIWSGGPQSLSFSLSACGEPTFWQSFAIGIFSPGF